MQYTGKQIFEKGIVTGKMTPEQIQQQGIDVRIRSIRKLEYEIGRIPATGKTKIPKTRELSTSNDNTYYLSAGYYELEFEEGCNIPKDATMYFKTRSSLVRCGCTVESGQFDGGFHTEHMGAFLNATCPIMIEKGARVAQCIVHESYPVDTDSLYNGQWQNDCQRNS